MANVNLANVKAQLNRIEGLLKAEKAGISGSASHKIGKNVQQIQDHLIALLDMLDKIEKLQVQMNKKISKLK
jgi:hypothetical protein